MKNLFFSSLAPASREVRLVSNANLHKINF